MLVRLSKMNTVTYVSLLLVIIVMALLVDSTFGFAAAKKKSSKQTASTNKGFGAPPPSLEEVLSQFRSRLPADSSAVDCPCGSAKTYRDCCEPFHQNQKKCMSPSDVLKTRYTAFNYRLVKYVMDTSHPTCRDYKDDRIAWAKDLNKGGMFDSYDFIGLEYGDEVIDNDEGFIEFTVRLRAKQSDALEGKETIVREKSRFLADKDGVWTYASGEVHSDVAGLEGVKLNV